MADGRLVDFEHPELGQVVGMVVREDHKGTGRTMIRLFEWTTRFDRDGLKFKPGTVLSVEEPPGSELEHVAPEDVPIEGKIVGDSGLFDFLSPSGHWWGFESPRNGPSAHYVVDGTMVKEAIIGCDGMFLGWRTIRE